MKPVAKIVCAVAVSLSLVSVTQLVRASEAAKTQAPKVDLAAGEAKYTAICAACHGTAGNSAIAANPKLSGQHAAYLNTQLQHFKSGQRANAIMSGMVAALTPADMINLSAYLSQQKSKPGFAKDKALVMMGEAIYRGGIAERQIPACAGCHSPNGAGIPDQYPALAGQHADYTAAQLTAYREGGRKHPSMTLVAAKLNNREIQAVADYIAGLR